MPSATAPTDGCDEPLGLIRDQPGTLLVRAPLTGEWVEVDRGWGPFPDPPPACPRCGARCSAKIAYGYPDPRTWDEWQRLDRLGLVISGGCCVEAANRHCHRCRHEWDSGERWDEV